MAKPNISLLGATYSGVAGVTLPQSGGGTATFPWVEGSQEVTQNGTVDVTSIAQVVVNVAGGGGGGLEYETGTYTTSSNIARPTITWSKAHTEAPVFVHMCDVTGTSHNTTYSNYAFTYCDPYKLWGYGYPYTSSGFRYAIAYYSYRGSSTSNISSAVFHITNNSDSTSSSGTDYPRYWVSPTDFHPYSNSSSRYWRTGRTYKWIAVWKPTT